MTHRLVGFIGDRGTRKMITKGDGAPDPDAPWNDATLIARVSAVERGGAQISLDASAAAKMLARLAWCEWSLWRPGMIGMFRRAARRLIWLLMAMVAWLMWLTR